MQLLESGARSLGYPLDAEQMDRFERYRRVLLQWNKRFNLTAIDSPEGIEVRHFLDSLSALRALDSERGFPDDVRLLDIGSGAGFPGIPLKIAVPALSVTLLEATGKKVAFLKHAAEALQLNCISAIHGRAEDRAHETGLREAFHAVVARAVAPLAVLCELGLPFLRVGGLFIAMKKGDTLAELEHAASAMAQLGGQLEDRIEIELPGLTDERHIICIRKTGPTPVRFPRRPGIPARKPL